MFPRLALAAATLSAAILVSVSSAQAFNCAIPGIFSVAKKTVCSDPILAALDNDEASRFAGLRARLGAEAMVSVGRDRRVFVAILNRCGRETRCHEASYTSQTRLYRSLLACADRGGQKIFCVNRTILKHREELHRSL